MLYKGETFNERKRAILKDMLWTKRAITDEQAHPPKWPHHYPLYQETLTLYKELFHKYLNELVALKKWRVKEGIGEDEQYGL